MISDRRGPRLGQGISRIEISQVQGKVGELVDYSGVGWAGIGREGICRELSPRLVC